MSDLVTTFQAAASAFRERNWIEAEALCRQILTADSRHADALHMLALVCSETDRPDDAVTYLREAIAQQPENPALWVNLGIIYRETEQFAQTIECELQAIRLRDELPEAYYNLSLAYHGLGQFENAAAAAVRAVELRPEYPEAQYHVGNLLLEDGRPKGAVGAYEAALRLRPDWAEAHYYLGVAHFQLFDLTKAIEQYREALRLEPTCISAAHSAAVAWGAMGFVEEAQAACARIEAAKAASARLNAGSGKSDYHDPMAVLFRESMAAVIPPDREYIAQYKARVEAAVRAFAAEPLELDLPNLHTEGAMPSWAWAYYGGNVRPVMEQYAQAIGPKVPRSPLRPRQGKPKLGIVVTQTHERVFARCWGRIAERLSREIFDVRILCTRGGANVLQGLLNIPKEEFLRLPDPVDQAARLIDAQQFDWLHYWEIGTDLVNYYLPFFRLAPGQSTCWGWPVTSGDPCVDSYLSCEQLEPPGAAAHYTEQLVLLKRFPTYSARPAVLDGRLGRSHFALEERQRVYLCTQRLRKFHPDFDLLLGDLLRSDPQGVLVAIGDAQPTVNELLTNRLRRTMPDVLSRVRFVPQMEREDYLALVGASDVVLDTLHYGAGANTVYDAVAVGTPIISLPGEFHRSLWAAGVNRWLGVERLIASTAEEYVAKAIEVATNADLRQSLRKQILDAGAALFEDAAVVREHEEYFSQAIAATRARG